MFSNRILKETVSGIGKKLKYHSLNMKWEIMIYRVKFESIISWLNNWKIAIYRGHRLTLQFNVLKLNFRRISKIRIRIVGVKLSLLKKNHLL